MRLKHYFPISVGIFLLVMLTARYFSVPFAPFAFILLVGETLLGFQMENHKVPRVLGDLLKPSKPSTH